MNSPAREAILQRLRRGTPGGARPAPENPVRRFDWSPRARAAAAGLASRR